MTPVTHAHRESHPHRDTTSMKPTRQSRSQGVLIPSSYCLCQHTRQYELPVGFRSSAAAEDAGDLVGRVRRTRRWRGGEVGVVHHTRAWCCQVETSRVRDAVRLGGHGARLTTDACEAFSESGPVEGKGATYCGNGEHTCNRGLQSNRGRFGDLRSMLYIDGHIACCCAGRCAPPRRARGKALHRRAGEDEGHWFG